MELGSGTLNGIEGVVAPFGVVPGGCDTVLLTDDGVLKPTGVVAISLAGVVDRIAKVIGIKGVVPGGWKMVLDSGTLNGIEGVVAPFGVVPGGCDTVLLTDDGVLKPTGVVAISLAGVVDRIAEVIGINGVVPGGRKMVLDSGTLNGTEGVVAPFGVVPG